MEASIVFIFVPPARSPQHGTCLVELKYGVALSSMQLSKHLQDIPVGQAALSPFEKIYIY